LGILTAAVLLFLLVPVFIVVPMSFSDATYLEFPPRAWSLRWYEAYFGSLEWMAATRTSFAAALCTVVLATPIGFAAAYCVDKLEGRGRAMLMAVLLSPQLMPVILLAIGVFFLYIRLGLVDSFAGVVLAHVALAIPFVVTTVAAGLSRFDRNLENAARSLGASRLRAIVDVVLPQVKMSVMAGALFAFVSSLDEVVIGLLVAGGPNTVLTRMMFMSLRDQVDPTIAAISTLLIGISLVAVALFLVMERAAARSAARSG
ncbi:ABC transporter permease, partial [Geminicoccus flavidas]|uniref:ABC transporter permease n=1 Tax=Geminicoccus flavidas TaxID=2506407 RepID=UPI002AB29459